MFIQQSLIYDTLGAIGAEFLSGYTKDLLDISTTQNASENEIEGIK